MVSLTNLLIDHGEIGVDARRRRLTLARELPCGSDGFGIWGNFALLLATLLIRLRSGWLFCG